MSTKTPQTGPKPDQVAAAHRPVSRPRPPRVTGAAHVLAAAGYSLQGLRRLWRETALRHMGLVGALCLLLLAAIGASWVQMGIFAILFLALVATEALNTAIECIIDHLAPDWQEFARDAKDLGSLATMCMLLATGIFLVGTVLVQFELI
ncbi:diacylglycerol kinase [Roseovarius nanhaiticus]|uniref:Diacylglycerol kinase n=1 Tax=Roseovarius nanhaiticus TaxID=573024 RepID=A0A1N7FBL3_9RHOB|nr:diacylglycerol kinase [Roseovarius nanhaiticus]SEK57949.1 diacylglycerol kinase [Roseovarius nanhaiticus]SIR97741.1 diacylglycerol kinase [Roseovarius nanhaiticus]